MYHPLDLPLRNCLKCGDSYKPKKTYQQFCSVRCRVFKNNEGKPFFRLGLATGTVGAIAELMVSCDLMRRGFELYRALSQSSSCDLLALRGGVFYSVEVRSGQHTIKKGVQYSKQNIRAQIVAVVTHVDEEIHYFPPFES